MFEYPDGATLLDPDEIEGLIPTHVVNRQQLNELEQQNIAQASLWLATARMGKINTDANLRIYIDKCFHKSGAGRELSVKQVKILALKPIKLPLN